MQSTIEPREASEAGNQVVVVGDTAGTTVAAGTAFRIRAVHVWTLRAGRVVRFEPHPDTPTMRRALSIG